MKTCINDSFPLSELECQYYDICKSYAPGKCQYDSSCTTRQELRRNLEDYVSAECLKEQVNEIVN